MKEPPVESGDEQLGLLTQGERREHAARRSDGRQAFGAAQGCKYEAARAYLDHPGQDLQTLPGRGGVLNSLHRPGCLIERALCCIECFACLPQLFALLPHLRVVTNLPITNHCSQGVSLGTRLVALLAQVEPGGAFVGRSSLKRTTTRNRRRRQDEFSKCLFRKGRALAVGGGKFAQVGIVPRKPADEKALLGACLLYTSRCV